ncbi:MAG: class I SAM-dependent methyltransferase, partial [Candidatus Hydrogenedentota bacterium]
MRRFHLIEIHEQDWMPESLRSATTDYLAYVEDVSKIYDPVVPVLAEAIRESGADRVVDLCSGGAGPWGRLQGLVSEELGKSIEVVLTDLNPNRAAFEYVSEKLGAGISFSDAPVDVLDVPEGMSGFRTLFSSFHHFRPDDARKILGDAVAKGEGIAVVEATHRSLVGILPMFHVPLIVWLVTPFIRPFRVSRLFWTYLVPLAPLIIG